MKFTLTDNKTRYAPQGCGCDEEAEADVQRIASELREERAQVAAQHKQDIGLNKGRWEVMTFASWERKRNPPSSIASVDSALGYVNSAERSGKNWLYFCGPYGTGKTHLAIAILHELIDTRIWTSCAVVWPEFIASVQESWAKDSLSQSEGRLWLPLRYCTLLLIDDLDKRPPSQWSIGKLYELIEYRSRHEKPTVFTANRTLEQLGYFWDGELVRDAAAAILSRFAAQLWGTIAMSGKDQRWEG